MTYAMTVYEINGQQIYVREEGTPNKQVALLIHGWSSSWFALSPIFPSLSKRFRCMAVDLPGYGKSPRGEEPATMPGYADLLAALIQEVSPKRPIVLIGHSMGGMISLTLTSRHPQLVERMILLSPTISGHLSLFIDLFIAPITMLERFAIGNLLVSLFESQMMWATDRLMRPASIAENSGVTEADYRQLRADARRLGQGQVRAECFWAMRQGDLRGKLGGINTPTLAIWGLEDNTVPLRDASVLADELADVDLRFIPKASHWPQFETPDLTRRYIEGFLGRPMNLLMAEF